MSDRKQAQPVNIAAFARADALRLPFADNTFDMVFTSPPYMDARTYGIDAQRGAVEWVDWMLDVVDECVRVTKGLVLVNCAGVTRDWCYWPGCEGLMWEWFKRGNFLWRPAYWHRVGIPGSGGKQWLRADVEYVIPFVRERGEIPWADNTANGHPPKWGPGGEMAHRLSNGKRVNQWGPPGSRKGGGDRSRHGKPSEGMVGRPSHVLMRGVQHRTDGSIRAATARPFPVKANPGNWISTGAAGGGKLGNNVAHENEAPFPEKLAEWFIAGWCPPGGRVLDPFSGSGTTAAVAQRMGRVGIGCDLRMSQCELGQRRVNHNQFDLFATEAA